MNNFELKKEYQRLTALIDNTKSSTYGDLELQGHWGKYLCVLASGFLENAISAVYSDFVSNVAPPDVTRYILKNIKKIQNPKAQRFIDVAYEFKKEWGVDLKTYFSDNPDQQEAIDSIMKNRHLVAHGQPTDIAVYRVKEYLDKSIKVIEFIEKQCANSVS